VVKDWKVFVTRHLPGNAVGRLAEGCRVEVNPEDRPLERAELLSGVSRADAVICLLTDRIDEEVLAAAETVKIFANYAVGYNNIDVDAAARRGILVTNTPDVLDDTTADFAWALLMAVARRVVEADGFVRENRFQGWSPTLFLGKDITGRTLGILGAGRIGRAVAERAAGFGMRILYHDLHSHSDLERETGAVQVGKDELLEQADFVSVHVPLTEDTRHMIGSRELARMKRSAVLINTSRGPTVDEQALVEALKEGEIWGAGLDVFEDEPQVHPGLLHLPNVVLAPHIASASGATREKMAAMAVDNVMAVMEGRKPRNLVN